MGTAGVRRITELDGLRGWASLCVVAFHFTWEMFGRLDPVFLLPLLAPVLNGRMAVEIFLAISGFVLTYNGWGNADKAGIRAQLAKRYLRLAVPILATSIIVCVLMMLGLTYNVEAAALVGREDWLAPMLGFEPSLLMAAFWSAVTVFFVNHPSSAYNVFLWTMIYELWGSYLVLLICLFERKLRPATVLAVISVLLLAGPEQLVIGAPFTLGALAALLARRGRFGWLMRVPFWAVAAAVSLALVAGGVVQVQGEVPVVTAILASAIVVLIVASPGLGALLQGPVSQALGRQSFPLYLVQMPIIVSISSFAVVWAGNNGALSVPVAAAIAIGSIALCLVSAWLLMPVERLTAWIGRRVGALAR